MAKKAKKPKPAEPDSPRSFQPIGPLIMQLRIDQGLSPAKLAKKAGVSRGMVKSAEASNPAFMDNLTAIANALGVAFRTIVNLPASMRAEHLHFEPARHPNHVLADMILNTPPDTFRPEDVNVIFATMAGIIAFKHRVHVTVKYASVHLLLTLHKKDAQAIVNAVANGQFQLFYGLIKSIAFDAIDVPQLPQGIPIKLYGKNSKPSLTGIKILNDLRREPTALHSPSPLPQITITDDVPTAVPSARKKIASRAPGHATDDEFVKAAMPAISASEFHQIPDTGESSETEPTANRRSS
jgi:transcriptional regulator with XRE-family HTH domain